MDPNEQILASPEGQPEIPEALPVAMEPVQSEERVQIIDMLRGFALLGILCVNMQMYTAPFSAMGMQPPYWPEMHDVMATRFITFFAVGKFYTMFSFLFGLGVAIQLLRARERGRSFGRYHIRRMLVLLGMGLVHAFFIWMGDILVTYAVLGFLLMLFVDRKPKTLLVWSGISLAVPIILIGLGAGFLALARLSPEFAKEMDKASEQAGAESKQQIQKEVQTYSRGSWPEVTILRASQLLFVFVILVGYQGPVSFAMFLIGMYVWRRGFLLDIPAHRSLFRKGCLWGLIIGLAGNALYLWGMENANMSNPSGIMWAGMVASVIATPALSCFYGCSIVLLSENETWRKLLQPLAAVGRMALTNYLAQSLICTTIFYSYSLAWPGFGLYAQIGPLAGIGLTLAIYIVQVLWSIWWLRHFRFGPMEWLWRTLTYGQMQPMRL